MQLCQYLHNFLDFVFRPRLKCLLSSPLQKTLANSHFIELIVSSVIKIVLFCPSSWHTPSLYFLVFYLLGTVFGMTLTTSSENRKFCLGLKLMGKHSFTSKFNVCSRFFLDAFVRLRKFPSILSFWKFQSWTDIGFCQIHFLH